MKCNRLKQIKVRILTVCLLAGFADSFGTVLNVPQIYQEQTNWCWCATSEAVLEYYCFLLTQTEIAAWATPGQPNTWNWLYGSSSNPTRLGVNLILDHFGAISCVTCDYLLPQLTVQDEIDSSRPIPIRWGWDSGGGHILAIKGIEGNNVYLMDPWYGATINTYSWVCDGNSHTWTHSLRLTTNPPVPPSVADIPDQTIFVGESFAIIYLDNYVEDADTPDEQIIWSYSGNTSMQVDITNRIATITQPGGGWSGSESITFRATDPGGLWDEDAALFTVLATLDPVLDLTITTLDEDVLLEWSAVEYADEYKVFRLVEPYTIPGTLVGTTVESSYTLVDELLSQSRAFYVVTSVHIGVPDLTLIPCGTFMMGSTNGAPQEEPVHQVTLTHDFYLSTHEVTNEKYRIALQWAYDHGLVTASSSTVQAYGEELLDLDDDWCELTFSGGIFSLRESPDHLAQGAYPSGYDPTNHPVKEVTWYGAACYCDWLSLMIGVAGFYNGNWDQTAEHNPYTSLTYRLPTEAEWEYAASYNDDRIYPWGDESPNCDYANYQGCVGWTAPVGNYPTGASQLGLMDMAGNLWELVGDGWGFYSSDPQTDPLGSADGEFRMIRGGAWCYSDYYLRCADRMATDPFESDCGQGFRIARTVNP